MAGGHILLPLWKQGLHHRKETLMLTYCQEFDSLRSQLSASPPAGVNGQIVPQITHGD
jgi:hypothetical protein